MNSLIDIILIVVPLLYVLFFPGFFLSFVFFPQGKIDTIERIALSFALSIAIVPLFMFYANLIGIPITTFSVLLSIGFLMALIGMILLVQQMVRESKHKN